nr:uncharacterized protein LOC117219992 [Megalopta genalis]
MPIFCAIIGLLKLVILLILTAFLFSLAAVTRLMEMTVVVMYPVPIFVLRLFSGVVVWLVKQTAGVTVVTYGRICTLECSPIEIDIRAPEVKYERSALPGLVHETVPVVAAAVAEELETVGSTMGPTMAAIAELTIEPAEAEEENGGETASQVT